MAIIGGIVWSVIYILGLIAAYRQHTQYEHNLVFKLIGYSIIGSGYLEFTGYFVIHDLRIPYGIIPLLYLLRETEVINRTAKLLAIVVGLLSFTLGYAMAHNVPMGFGLVI